ncbi:hypothetical protein BH10PSE7_BH10PSE7_43750 [soil metagenome]
MLAIRNFGHFWNRGLVDWGKPGRGTAGRLLGYYLKTRIPFQVDFRDQIGIYVLFTASRDVVYIGQAGSGDHRLFDRLKLHTRNHLRDRWTNFSWFGLKDVNQTGVLSEHQQPQSNCSGTNSDALDEIEAILLQLFEPRLNKQGPRWKDAAKEYLQYVPWEWEDDKVAPIDPTLLPATNRIDALGEQMKQFEKMLGKRKS